MRTPRPIEAAAWLWAGVSLLVPLGLIALISLLKRGPYGQLEWSLSLESHRLLVDPIYGRILASTLLLAGATALLCWLISLPLAWTLVQLPKRTKLLFLVLICLPSLTNLLIRIYALQILSRQPWLESLGFSVGPGLVLFGMVSTYLPFMLLPIFLALEKMDPRVLEAALDLGANRMQLQLKVVLPLLRPASLTGTILVFVPCIGEFVIPDLLGGAQTPLIGNVITEQFLKVRNWPLGAAMAFWLVVALAVFQMAIQRRESSP